MEQIACKECTSPDCHGCNMYRLERMLMRGELDALMDGNHAIIMDADVRPVVFCRDCRFWSKNFPEDGYGWCSNYVVGTAERSENFFCAVGVGKGNGR